MYQAELKEWHNGLLKELLLTVPIEGGWNEVWFKIQATFEEGRIHNLWKDALLTIDFGLRPVTSTQMEELLQRLRETYHTVTIAVIAPGNTTREAAKQLGITVYSMAPGTSKSNAEVSASRNNALYITQTVRSGQRLFHTGHIVINGDVNAGAEILATGDIIITGTLRGLAHAGYEGDTNAKIIAGNMRPHQIRIADQIARSPEDAKQTGPRYPEVARIEHGAIQVFPV